MAKKPLSKVHARVLRWVENFIAENNFAPTFQEIADGLGFRQIYTVDTHLTALKQKQYLTFVRGKERTIVLIDQDGIGMHPGFRKSTSTKNAEKVIMSVVEKQLPGVIDSRQSYSTKALAEMFDKDPGWVAYRMVQAGIPCKQIGVVTIIHGKHLNDWIERESTIRKKKEVGSL